MDTHVSEFAAPSNGKTPNDGVLCFPEVPWISDDLVTAISCFDKFNRVAIRFDSVKYCFGILFSGFGVARNVVKWSDIWIPCFLTICPSPWYTSLICASLARLEL